MTQNGKRSQKEEDLKIEYNLKWTTTSKENDLKLKAAPIVIEANLKRKTSKFKVEGRWKQRKICTQIEIK